MENFYQKVKDKLASIHPEELPSEASVNDMMQALDKIAPTGKNVRSMPKESMRSYNPLKVWKIAASVSILAVFGYLLYAANEVHIVVSKRAHKLVQLPDGSTVSLNSASELTYNKLDWYISRKVKLNGEAFFMVQKGSTFEVRSTLGVTNVLGTSFNIYARGSKYEVSCHTGKVSVRNNTTGKEALLIPGKKVVWITNEQRGAIFDFDTSKTSDWRTGEFYFEDVPFFEVVEEFERQFDVYVKHPESLKNELYTGYFDNRNFDQALKFICDPMHLFYEVNGNIIRISTQKTD